LNVPLLTVRKLEERASTSILTKLAEQANTSISKLFNKALQSS